MMGRSAVQAVVGEKLSGGGRDTTKRDGEKLEWWWWWPTHTAQVERAWTHKLDEGQAKLRKWGGGKRHDAPTEALSGLKMASELKIVEGAKATSVPGVSPADVFPNG